MIFGHTKEDAQEWHTWFAWHFVQLDDGRWAFLSLLQRRDCCGIWIYRPYWSK